MDPSRLLGRWEFRREVRDHRDGTQYAAAGAATFTPEDDGRVRWAEEGTLRWADRSTPVSRTLYLVRESGGWRVTFEDGRDFHPWTERPVEHVCGRDLYEGTVRFLADQAVVRGPAEGTNDHLVLRWDVRGPAKDYSMVTHYTRTPRGSA